MIVTLFQLMTEPLTNVDIDIRDVPRVTVALPMCLQLRRG